MSVKKGLGRGFESLVPTEFFDESFDVTLKEDNSVSDLRKIKITDIIADPTQPRRDFDDNSLNSLADSIKKHGVLQPIVVSSHKGKFMIVAGERRFRASKIARLDKIPAIVRTLSGQHRLEIALIENLQREDLNPLETAIAYAKLKDQFNLTLEQISKQAGGGSVSAVSNKLRLLKLPDFIKKEIANNNISEGQARSLIGVDDKLAKNLLQQIIKEGWSVRRVEQAVSSMKDSKVSFRGTQHQNNINYEKDFIHNLNNKLATKTAIKSNKSGGGKIIISFKDQKDLDRIKNYFSK